MVGMRLGGIDPSILRELSGVYKPFVKAFKELISNAFDADADNVRVDFSDDFSTLTVTDDGVGMTPFEFRNDFTRIGGGSRRWAGDRTRKGRLRIGSKGIGFLAMARYCSRLEVESAAGRSFDCRIELPRTPTTVDLDVLLGVPIGPAILAPRLKYRIRGRRGTVTAARAAAELAHSRGRSQLKIGLDIGAAVLHVRVDCSGIRFRATLDFDRLLQLADTANLEEIDDFTSIELFENEGGVQSNGTRITAYQLKPFVRRELRAERRKGNVRNVASWSGLDQFVWHLSRCTPVAYVPTPPNGPEQLQQLLGGSEQPVLAGLSVHHAGKAFDLLRPVYPLEPEALPFEQATLIPVHLDERGVNGRGFLAGYESVIFPAEYRGITIRVRGVAIGDPGFLGAEHLVTGAQKVALSQITGEINILAGMDAADTLNPGRESFYEESEPYKILRRHLLGEGEQVGGLVGQAIAAVLRRSQVRCHLRDVLGRAGMRRRALEDVSAAVTHFIASGDPTGSFLRHMIRRTHSYRNGLAGAPDLKLGPPDRVGGFAVVKTRGMVEHARVEYATQLVHLDTSRPEWDWSIQLFDRRFQVVHKLGEPRQAIAEVDLKDANIFVNWAHPVRAQMDERGFLRTALAWVLAKEACRDDADHMMDLALKLLSFTVGNADA